jgi:hypothetical protein
MTDCIICLARLLPSEVIQSILLLIGVINIQDCLYRLGLDPIEFGNVIKQTGGFITGPTLWDCLWNAERLHRTITFKIHYYNPPHHQSIVPHIFENTINCAYDAISYFPTKCYYRKYYYDLNYDGFVAHIQLIEYKISPIEIIDTIYWLDHSKVYFDGHSINVPPKICLIDLDIHNHHFTPQTNSIYIDSLPHPVHSFRKVCQSYNTDSSKGIKKFFKNIFQVKASPKKRLKKLQKHSQHMNQYQKEYLETAIKLVTTHKFILNLTGNSLNDLLNSQHLTSSLDNHTNFMQLKRVIKELIDTEELGFVCRPN